MGKKPAADPGAGKGLSFACFSATNTDSCRGTSTVEPARLAAPQVQAAPADLVVAGAAHDRAAPEAAAGHLPTAEATESQTLALMQPASGMLKVQQKSVRLLAAATATAGELAPAAQTSNHGVPMNHITNHIVLNGPPAGYMPQSTLGMSFQGLTEADVDRLISARLDKLSTNTHPALKALADRCDGLEAPANFTTAFTLASSDSLSSMPADSNPVLRSLADRCSDLEAALHAQTQLFGSFGSHPAIKAPKDRCAGLEAALQDKLQLQDRLIADKLDGLSATVNPALAALADRCAGLETAATEQAAQHTQAQDEKLASLSADMHASLAALTDRCSQLQAAVQDNSQAQEQISALQAAFADLSQRCAEVEAAVRALTQSVSSVQDLSELNRAQIREMDCMVKQAGDSMAAVSAEVGDHLAEAMGSFAGITKSLQTLHHSPPRPQLAHSMSGASSAQLMKTWRRYSSTNPATVSVPATTHSTAAHDDTSAAALDPLNASTVSKSDISSLASAGHRASGNASTDHISAKGLAESTAAGDLAAAPAGSMIDAVIRNLHSSSMQVHAEALWLLREMTGAPDAAAASFSNPADCADDFGGCCAARAKAAAMQELSRLTELLGSSNSNVQRDAAAVLRNLAYADTASRAAIASNPACLEALVQLLHSRNAAVQDKVVGALWNLACTQEVAAVIEAAPGCLHELVALLSSSNAGVQEKAAGTLRNLACTIANADVIAAVPGWLAALVGLLSSADEHVQEQAAGALRNMACEDAANQAAIAAVPGCLSALINLLDTGSTGVQEKAAGALWNLSMGNPINTAVITGAPGCLDTLAKLSHGRNDDLCLVAIGALACLSGFSHSDNPQPAASISDDSPAKPSSDLSLQQFVNPLAECEPGASQPIDPLHECSGEVPCKLASPETTSPADTTTTVQSKGLVYDVPAALAPVRVIAKPSLGVAHGSVAPAPCTPQVGAAAASEAGC